MSRIKSYLLGFITLCSTFTVYAQQTAKPSECYDNKILAAGHKLGADFSINPGAGCLTDNTRANGAEIFARDVKDPSGAPITGGTSTVKFNFNYRDIDGPISFAAATASTPSFKYKDADTYWIVVNGVIGTNSYLTCKSVEVINTHKLDIDYDFCDPLNVRIVIKDTPTNREQSKILITWSLGNNQTYDVSTYPFTINYSYATRPTSPPKVQGIYVRGSTPACTSDGLNLDITPIEAPKILSLESLAGGTQHTITAKGGTADVDFAIEMKPKGGAWTSTGQTIKIPATTGATASTTITTPTNSGEYCFRLQKSGICGSATTSDPVCTIKSTNQVLSPKDVKIDWTSESYNPPAIASITGYKVFYRETPTNVNQNSVSVTASANPTFTFDVMECSKKYEFWIEGNWGTFSDRVTIKSAPFVVDPATGGRLPNALIGIASVGNNIVSINMFSNIQINKYNIYRAEGNSTNFQKITTVTTNTYQDNNVEQDKQQYCYKVDYEDACGNKSDLSDPFCTIFLTSARSNTLNWTPFSVVGSPSVLANVQATEYTIQVIDASGTVIHTTGSTLTTEADVQATLDNLLNDPTLNGRVTFRILATQDADLILATGPIPFPFFSYSNTYTFITPALVYVPTAFTPNDDGPAITEVFKAYGKFIAEFNMVIYNRWGAPIFETKNIDIGWDGKENGTPAPPGNYGYKIFGIDNAGQEFKRVGSVLLLK